MVLADLQLEVLGHLLGVHHPPCPQPDGALTLEASACHRRGDPREGLLGGCQERLALARPLGREGRVAAHHEALAGKVGTADLGEVALVEERELQDTLLDQAADGGGAQGADPVDPTPFAQALDARAREHAPIARHDQALDAEALREQLEAGLHGGRISGVAGEGLDADGPSACVEQQAEDDLLQVGSVRLGSSRVRRADRRAP